MTKTFNATKISALDASKLAENDTLLGELNDAIREIIACVQGEIYFTRTATLRSATGNEPVNILAGTDVPTNKKVYVNGFVAKVNGATVWGGGITTVKIQDTNIPAKDFFTMAIAALTANAEVRPGSANVTSGQYYSKGTGGSPGKGLQVIADGVGTGSDLIVTVWGVIK